MKRIALLVLVALGVAGLSALGVWQIERRAWKLALIERVEQRVQAPAVPAPGPSEWADLTRENSEYLHVMVRGRFVADRQVLSQAVTDRGAGYWVLAPFQSDEGFVVLVNRGFVPWEARKSVTAAASEPISVTGLLRITEPKGGFLRKNDPTRDQWYSRDVQAISQTLGLTGLAPYFIDAEAPHVAGQSALNAPGAASTEQSAGEAATSTEKPNSEVDGAHGASPIPGLTVISFHNSHLVYAITWFSLALMVAALGIRIARHRR